MGRILNLVVVGLFAAGVMLVARVALSRLGLGLPNYPVIELNGHAGLMTLLRGLGYGAAFAVIHGTLVRPVLPSGLLFPALVFSIVPFITFSMALPMWQGGDMVSNTWELVYIELHWFIFSLALVLLGKGGSGTSKSSKE